MTTSSSSRYALNDLPQRIEEIAASIADPSVRAALRVVVLEAQHTSEAASAALAELRSMPDGPEKLHWSLRYLAGRPEEAKRRGPAPDHCRRPPSPHHGLHRRCP